MIGNKKIDLEFIGMRPGEKIHEILVSEEEISRTVKQGKYYVIRPILPELRCSIIKPSLTKELSSADQTMNKKDLRTFLKKEGFLEF
jgi:FlaA1/EpsC-like NDP-sugar epimerase